MTIMRWGLMGLVLLFGAGNVFAQSSTLFQTKDVTLHSAVTANGNGTLLNVSGWATVTIQASGITTATVTAQVSNDTVQGWNSAPCILNDGTVASALTANGSLQCSVAGYKYFRAPISSYSAGTITVKAVQTTAASRGLGGGGGGGGSGDVTDVWGCTSGNCNALTGAAGDSLDAGSADSSKPATRSTSLPGTCTEGQLHQDTDSGGSEHYVCIAANTWVKLIGASDTHQLLSTTHSDTVAGSPVTGDLLIGDEGNLWSSLGGPTSATERCFNSLGSGTAATVPYWGACSPINAQTGTTYTFVASDSRKLVTFSNASSTAATLPQATTAGFAAGYYFYAKAIGAGTATITPTTSTINGAASLALAQNEGAIIWSDGTNYQALRLGQFPASAISTPTDDNVLVGNGTTFQNKAVPDCTDTGGNHLNYTASSNSISCGTSVGSASLRTTHFSLEEEFCGGSNATGSIGNNGLYFGGVGTAAMAVVTATAGHPCIVSLATGATSGNLGYLGWSPNAGRGAVLGDIQKMSFIIRPQSVDANTAIRCGFITAVTTTLEGSDGVYLSYLNSASANWRAVTQVGGSKTATSSSVAAAVDTWVQLDITRNGSNWDFSINEAAAFSTPATSTGPAGTVDGHIACAVDTATTAAKTVQFDYMGWASVSPLTTRHP